MKHKVAEKLNETNILPKIIAVLVIGIFLYLGQKIIRPKQWAVYIYDRGEYWENNERGGGIPSATLHITGYSTKKECLKALYDFTKEDSPYYKTGPEDDYVALCQRGCDEGGYRNCKEVCHLNGHCF